MRHENPEGGRFSVTRERGTLKHGSMIVKGDRIAPFQQVTGTRGVSLVLVDQPGNRANRAQRRTLALMSGRDGYSSISRLAQCSL
jgi:hypothetical protein